MKKIIKAYEAQIRKDGDVEKAYSRLKKDFPKLIKEEDKISIRKILS